MRYAPSVWDGYCANFSETEFSEVAPGQRDDVRLPAMVNVHYARIGDVWKHLPLAEVLAIERPCRYWESHAGSSSYPLTRSPERDYGVFLFLERAVRSSVLEGSLCVRSPPSRSRRQLR